MSRAHNINVPPLNRETTAGWASSKGSTTERPTTRDSDPAALRFGSARPTVATHRPGRPRLEHGPPLKPRSRYTYVSARAKRCYTAMVRKKKLSPSGAKDDDGEYHNVHVNLHEDELAVAGLAIGDNVFVRVRDGKIIIQKADPEEVEHEF